MEYFTTAAGITVHLYDSEDHPGEVPEKKTLLLIHGYLETMYIWQQFEEKLRDRYRVILIDIPGHGLTDSAPADGNGEIVNSMEFCAEVANAVLEKCGVSKAFVGGHSIGGYAALLCASLYPGRFEKLIMFNATPYADFEGKEDDRKREISIINSGKLETLAYLSIPNMYHSDNLRKCDDKIRETIELCETHFPEGIIASIKGLHRRADISENMASLDMPALLISGDSDPFLPVETFDRMKREYAKVEFLMIPGTGHSSFVEAEDRCVDKVCEFLG